MRLLFVCVGNTCRSQMAEAVAKHMGHEAQSAGTNPGPAVAQDAIKVTGEIGIEMSGQYPKSIDDIVITGFDWIVSMGCGVECPTLPMDDDWGLEDPVGRGEAFYRKTLEEIKQRLLTLD
ncbi:MAG: arsenate reductase ArsC [Candidatus Thalassarchaeum sp.]|nr:arsenate reductase ArsC [Candidatus Thalassarchaeum sp.]HJM23307.1 arsenate reductase ArsC [Candidatus Thalassarchaeum sp.]